MKRVAILGSTGSIGLNALEVIKRFPREFKVVALSANSNLVLLAKQAREFKPEFVSLTEETPGIKKFFPGIKIFSGQNALLEMLDTARIDRAVMAISGAAALAPVLKLLDRGVEIALANKESLVMAGDIVMKKAAKKSIAILPIDSEQSAIWQCLQGQEKTKIDKIYLTASGGPFRKFNYKQLGKIRAKQALRHPRWKMGKKITIDSATLMNKGLELIEAVHLFNLPASQIEVVVHPEAIVHSMVKFIDGSVLAQLSVTDMCVPIQYALSYPERLLAVRPGLDFFKLKSLNFEKPDFNRFPCLGLAYQVVKDKGTAPCVLNAANEICVEEFLKNRIKFFDIAKVIEKVLSRHKNQQNPDLGMILDADRWARDEARNIIIN